MMNKVVILFSLIPILFAQGNDVITFSKDVTPNNSCGGFQGVKQTSDGGYIVAGCVDDKVWIAKLDAYGEKEWDNTYSLPNYWGSNSIIQTSDGGYLYAGWRGIMKIDSSGEFQWKKTSSGVANTYPYFEDVIEHSNGNYYAVGGPVSDKAHMAKFSPDGTLLKRKYYGGNCDDDKFRAIIETNDNMILMVGAKTHGNSQYPCSFEWYNDLWIVKANRNGRSLWQREYGGDKYEEAHDVVQNSDGGFTIIGEKCATTPGSCNSNTKVFLVTVDENGLNNQNQTFQNGGLTVGVSIANTVNGGIAWLASKNMNQPDYHGCWIKKSGSNEQSVNITLSGIAENLENTADGGFVIGTYGGTIHKTDSNFNIGTTASISEDIVAPEFFSLLQNFPNPFNPETTIEYNINYDGIVTITIFNTKGDLIKKIDHGNRRTGFHNYKWKGLNSYSELVPAGVYLYTVESSGSTKSGKMLMIK